MIGAIVLFQVAAVSISASDAPRQTVSAESADLSTFASQVHINRKALEGWVPQKGTPAPRAELPNVETIPNPPERWRNASREGPEESAAADSDESVNSFGEPRPYFFGSSGGHRPHFGPGRAHRRAPAGGAPGRMTRGIGRRRTG